MRIIKLQKITADRRDMYNDNEEGEGQQSMQTTPVSVNADAIRCFYPRKDNRPGTRITFTDGGGFAVAEAYEVLEGLLGAAETA